ncbi:MAG: efflux RND transporter permease subunit [Paracoccaceae bacterium]
MTGLVDWATARARMILAFVALSIGAGALAYVGLPKEGEPDIDVPRVFVSTPFPGISAADSERLLVKPLESELTEVDGLDKMTSYASEGYAGVLLEFEFGWDKAATLAQVREAVDKARTEFPEGFTEPSVDEFNFSEFPILVVSLSGDVPERTLLRLSKDLQTEVEKLRQVLEAGLAGHREEMVEVVLDPLRLEAYDITGQELINVVVNNNRLVAAGAVESGSGQFSVKLPSSFESTADIQALPIKVSGDRLIRMGDVADIRYTFEDRTGTARFNGEPTIALQVVKVKGAPVIDTVAAVKAVVEAERAGWPPALQEAVRIGYSMDESSQVEGMVKQLEGSVLTAVALVMIVVLAALGFRSALLVGFAVPVSFLLCFGLLAAFGMSITNIVMFGLILAVGMLVDGAIVVVEYADQRIRDGLGPMRAYAAAAKRMFWPIVSSTATTLCAFLPMLFWPGMPGEFMGNLPVTLIFVLSASLVVALLYLPVVGGLAGRASRALDRASAALGARLPRLARALLLPLAAAAAVGLAWAAVSAPVLPAQVSLGLGAAFAAAGVSVVAGSFRDRAPPPPPEAGYRRTAFGRVIKALVGNPVMPFVAIGLTVFAVFSAFSYYGAKNNGVEFFVETEPERAVAYVRARGNLSLAERDRLLRAVEMRILEVDGVESVFAFAGDGGLNQRGGGAPKDAVGRVQVELAPWNERRDGEVILQDLRDAISDYPGVVAEIAKQQDGPSQGKPVQLRLTGDDWEELLASAASARAKFESLDGLVEIEDTRPLPGLDWELDVDVATAGRFGADVGQIGPMVSMITRGVLLDTMRPEGSDEEIDIRVRFPEQDRVISTLDDMRIRTSVGSIPLSNFVERRPVPKLDEIARVDGVRFFDVKADVAPGVNANDRVAELRDWIAAEVPFPASIGVEFTGDQEEQAESQAFLAKAFVGALGLMFVILLAQFNSVYNSILVLSAVVMSVAGVLMGMLVMGQTFSIIMTGTGVVALAGIVVNNNIVLIDTYQEFARQMPRIEAIIRTAEQRIRPVLLTTLTTMAGLTPMMFGVSIDFAGGGYTVDAPTALWWKQLATAVVWGLGTATVLTLVVTPSALAARVWFAAFLHWLGVRAAAAAAPSGAVAALARLRRAAARLPAAPLVWDAGAARRPAKRPDGDPDDGVNFFAESGAWSKAAE